MSFSRVRHLNTGIAALLLVVAAIATYFSWPQPPLTVKDLAELDASVERGRYLATLGNCATCHTAKDGQPYAGGVEFHSSFGVVRSTNITPDPETGIGRWSFANFYQAMKRGVRPDGTPLYPAFPYPSFAKLSDDDIASLYLYLKTIPPVEAPAPANDLRFPYNVRLLLHAWNKLFHDAAAFEPDPDASPEWNRGAYLVQGIAHCGACHTPRNFLGAEKMEQAFTGGVIVDTVKPGKYRPWSAVNLTSHPTGLGHWSIEAIVAYLTTGESENAVVHGPMNEVVMSSTRYLEQDDARAIATYLKSLPPKAQPSGRKPSNEQLAAGKIAYTVHCGSCHLPTGKGDEGMGVTLAGNSIVQAADPSSLINVILYGPQLPPPPFVSDRTRMKPFGKKLSDEDIANLATYVRTSFGNQAGAVTPVQVKRQR